MRPGSSWEYETDFESAKRPSQQLQRLLRGDLFERLAIVRVELALDDRLGRAG